MRSIKRLSVLVVLFGILFLLAHNRAYAATIYTWNQTGTASWATTTNWTPSRTTPATDDILIFDNGATTTVTDIPTQTIGQLSVSANTTVNLQAAAVGTVLTISGGSGTDLSVGSGSQLNINKATNTLKLLIATGATGSISGSITCSAAAHTLDASDANAITFNSGATLTQGSSCTGNIFTASGTANAVVFASGSTFSQSQGANPFGLNAPNSKVVFQTGSLFRYAGSAATLSFSGRTYANLEFDPGTGTQTTSGSAALSIDNLTVKSGTLNIGMTGTFNLNGNIGVSSGATLNFNPASGATLTLGGSSTQTISNSGTLSFQANQNINITNTSGVNVTSAITLNGTTTIANTAILATSAGLTNSGTLNVNGTFQINSGGFVSGTAPTYATTALLKYNSGGTYGRGTEWSTTAGAGYPGNVQISNNTTLDLGANSGTGTARQIAGSLTIDSGSTMEMAGTNAMSAALTILGDVTNNGTLRLSTNNGGDIKVAGNWTRGSSGTFTPNNRAVFFNGTGTQILSVTGGGTETFNYLVLDKSAGSTQLSSSPATDVVVNATVGDALQLLNAGSLDLNGRTLTMSGTGGNLKTSGGARLITGTNTSTLSFTGNKTVTSASSGAIRYDVNVFVKISAQVGFGGSISIIKGTLQIDSGGSVASGSAPTYDTTSTLKYNSGGSYSANEEWYPNTPSGAGVPQNVQISNNTALNLGSTTFTRYISGNLTIDSGSSLALSSGSGGNLNIAGNWANSGTFTPNSRTVTFQSSSAQSITGATTFDFFTLSNGNGLTLNNDVTVNQLLSFTSGKIDAGSNTLTLDCSGTISGASSVNYIIGNLKKNYCATGSFTYPTGTSNGYSPVAATLTALATNPSSLQIKAIEGNPPGFVDAKTLDRYWSLTETGDLTTNLTFTYLASNVDGNESDYRIYRGTTQVCDETCVNEVAHTATINGVTEFSNWTMGEGSAPTVLGLASFKAKLTPKNKVQVKWKTGSELNILGFNLYRQTVGSKKWVKVNDEQIDSLHLGNPEGAVYKWIDKKVQSGKTYHYKLEVVVVPGPSELTEPIKITVPLATPTPRPM